MRDTTSAVKEIRARPPSEAALLSSLMIPVVMSLLTVTMVNLAIPSIRRQYHISVDDVAWVVTAYSLSSVVLMPLYGRLGDYWDKKGIYLLGVGIYALGSILCALSLNFGWLLAARLIQGIGGSGLNPLGMAIIAEVFPRERRGVAYGIWHSAAGAASSIGPLLGGVLIDAFGWHSIFWAVGLVAILGLGVAAWFIPSFSVQAAKKSFDLPGALLLVLGTGLLLLAAGRGAAWGCVSAPTLGLILGSFIAFLGFGLVEAGTPHPFVPLGMFARAEFTFTCASSGLRMFVIAGSTFAIALFLQEVEGLSPSRAGVLLLPSYLLLFLGILLGGRLSDRWGSRKPAALGMGMDTVAMLLLGFLRRDIPQWYPALSMGIHGLGAGLALAPYSRTVAMTFPGAQVGIASGLYSMMRFSGVALGAAITGSFLETRLTLHGAGLAAAAYRETFFILAGVAFFSALTAVLARPRCPH